MKEEWGPINGFEGIYEVSNTGSLRSLNRVVSDKRVKMKRVKGVDLKTQINPRGYEQVFLSKDGNQKSYSIHRLVAKAFIPNPENKPCVNHLDGDKTNNIVNNLEWCSYSENKIHSHEIGTSPRGETHPGNKLKEENVLEICRLLDETSLTHVEISAKFKVSSNLISRINLGKVWNWLTRRKGP